MLCTPPCPLPLALLLMWLSAVGWLLWALLWMFSTCSGCLTGDARCGFLGDGGGCWALEHEAGERCGEDCAMSSACCNTSCMVLGPPGANALSSSCGTNTLLLGLAHGEGRSR